MKQFLSKILLFAALFFIIVFIILTWIDYKGFTDAYYLRLSAGHNQSLIVGTSRAAQALQPSVIDSILSSNTQYNGPIQNFAFNVAMSPYGELYYSVIKQKLEPSEDKKTIFILAVDPFSLCVDTLDDEWDKKGYRETDNRLSDVHFLAKPCYEYLLHYCTPHQWVTKNAYETLHNDGWLEITPPSMDSTVVADNIRRKMDDYNKRRIAKSPYRIHWLEQTIELLQPNGNVYLVRIPVSYEMQMLEDSLWNNFDQDMKSISYKYNIPYYSFAKDYNQYQTTDGNHLYKTSGANFSKVLADSITQSYHCR